MSTREVVERMLLKNSGLKNYFVDNQNTVFSAMDGKPAYWVSIEKGATEEANTVRQSDRSSRDAVSDET